MKTLWIVLISFVATAVIVGGGTYYIVNAKATKDKDALQSQITDLNKKVTDTEKSLADTQATATTQTTVPTTTTTTEATHSALAVVSRTPSGTTNSMPETSKTLSTPLTQAQITFNNDLDRTTITSTTIQIMSGVGGGDEATLSYDSANKRITITPKTPYQPSTGYDTRITVEINGVKDIYGSTLSNYIYNIDLQK